MSPILLNPYRGVVGRDYATILTAFGGLQSRFKLDDVSGVLVDSVGGHNCTPTGTLTYGQPGLISDGGTCIRTFPAAAQASFNITSGLAAWSSATKTMIFTYRWITGTPALWTNSGGTGTNRSSLQVTGDTTLGVRLLPATAQTTINMTAGINLRDGAKHTIIMAIVGSPSITGYEFFVDGVSQGVITYTSSFATMCGGNLQFGRDFSLINYRVDYDDIAFSTNIADATFAAELSAAA